jgi:hypothetical protein
MSRDGIAGVLWIGGKLMLQPSGKLMGKVTKAIKAQTLIMMGDRDVPPSRTWAPHLTD